MSKKAPTSPDLQLPLKTKLLLSAISFVSDLSRRSNGTVNRSLFNLFDFKASPSDKPIKAVKSSDYIVDVHRNLWFRLYTPTSPSISDSLPLIVYFHGGGFVFLSPDSLSFDSFCRRLSRNIPAIVVSVNYRLSPEHRYPCQYEDGFDVLNFIDSADFKNTAPDVDLSKCFLAGDSAGGNIAHHVALKAVENEFRELKIRGIIALQPFFGGEERTKSEIELAGAPLILVKRTDWIWKAYLPEGEDRDHPVVNVFGPKSENIKDVKLPAIMVFVGGYDPLKDWQKRYYEGLKKSGKEAYLIEYPNAFHSFYMFPQLPESHLLLKDVKQFMQNQMH